MNAMLTQYKMRGERSCKVCTVPCTLELYEYLQYRVLPFHRWMSTQTCGVHIHTYIPDSDTKTQHRHTYVKSLGTTNKRDGPHSLLKGRIIAHNFEIKELLASPSPATSSRQVLNPRSPKNPTYGLRTAEESMKHGRAHGHG